MVIGSVKREHAVSLGTDTHQCVHPAPLYQQPASSGAAREETGSGQEPWGKLPRDDEKGEEW